MARAQSIYLHGGTLLSDGLATGDVLIDHGTIRDLDGSAPADAILLNARGLFVLPGIVDVHGDAFERHLMPRPRVTFDMSVALLDADRALVSNGVTTAFHGLTVSWEPGLRGPENARALFQGLDRLRGRFGADTRVHLRHETYNLDGEEELRVWLQDGRIGVLAFNDHLEGILKKSERFASVSPLLERSGLDEAEFMALAGRVQKRGNEVPASIERVARAARAAGVPMMSHDDPSPAIRRQYRELGARIAEFPMNEPTAADAAMHGEAVVLGAPNVLRGGSHTGCVSAAEMVVSGHCSVLASDYYYPSLLLAPFILARAGDVGFAQAWSLVSRGPAEAMGLSDRGTISPGKRADLILVAPDPQPRVVATIANGRLVHLADGSLIG